MGDYQTAEMVEIGNASEIVLGCLCTLTDSGMGHGHSYTTECLEETE